MFDNVGKSMDDEATKRSFASLVIASLLMGGVGAFTIGFGTYKAVEAVMELPDDEMVEVIIEDDFEAEAPPPPPPPPPPAAADAEDEEEEDETDDVPDEMVDEQKELEEKVEKEVKTQARPAGIKDGVEGGEKDGVIGGVKDGVKDGVIGGQLNGGIRVFHHSELQVKVRKMPVYPEEAAAMNLGDQRCKVSVKIDEKGIPYSATVKGCPDVFKPIAKNAILKWRWYPPKAGKKKVKAQTLIAVVFKAG